jgi:hypothetical protein
MLKMATCVGCGFYLGDEATHPIGDTGCEWEMP